MARWAFSEAMLALATVLLPMPSCCIHKSAGKIVQGI